MNRLLIPDINDIFLWIPTVGPVVSVSNDWNTSYGSTCWTIQLSPGSFSAQGLPATLSLSCLFCLKHSILKRPWHWKKPVNNLIFLKLRWPPTKEEIKIKKKKMREEKSHGFPWLSDEILQTVYFQPHMCKAWFQRPEIKYICKNSTLATLRYLNYFHKR